VQSDFADRWYRACGPARQKWSRYLDGGGVAGVAAAEEDRTGGLGKPSTPVEADTPYKNVNRPDMTIKLSCDGSPSSGIRDLR
jgi:hypothetical protein